MRHLALISMALMLCMPVLSRWQQMEAPDTHGMCLSEGSLAALGVDVHAHHPAHEDAPAHDHGHDACGYCVLATRMLPVLALVLALPLPQRARHVPQRVLSAPAARFEWPAHSPRGPPLRS